MNKPKQTPEDAFYENVTLGLIRTLSNLPRVCDLRWERRSPCEKAQLINWEQRHCVYLPDDMKKFYLSTDGFALYWSFKYGPADIRRVGVVHMPHLMQITLLRENVDATIGIVGNNGKTGGSSGPSSPAHACSSASSSAGLSASTQKDMWGHSLPTLSAKSKLFEINSVNNEAKVCLVYESTGTNNPKIYLLELKSYRWQFLADTFTEYLRMSIAHLGLPYWELCFSYIDLPSWTEQLYLLLAPHLLHEQDERRVQLVETTDYPLNFIDPNVFRTRPKGKSHTSGTASNVKNKHTMKDKQ